MDDVPPLYKTPWTSHMEMKAMRKSCIRDNIASVFAFASNI